MEYRRLGNSGLHVSIAGLGCNNFGRRTDAAGTKLVVERALELGVTLFDTADIYGPDGRSEELLGPLLRPHREAVVLATKAGGAMGEGPYRTGASRKYIITAVEASLRRLQTDYIDLLQVHFPDPTTPTEETMRALDDLVRSGKVRYTGCSNYEAWRIIESHWVARSGHLAPFVSAQHEYSLLARDIEREIVPIAGRYGLGVLPYFPLAHGFLTGKYRRGEPLPPGTRFAGSPSMAEGVLTDRNFDVLAKLEALAAAWGRTLTELALGWLAAKPFISSVIAGATRPEQVDENVRACQAALAPAELTAVEEALDGAAG